MNKEDIKNIKDATEEVSKKLSFREKLSIVRKSIKDPSLELCCGSSKYPDCQNPHYETKMMKEIRDYILEGLKNSTDQGDLRLYEEIKNQCLICISEHPIISKFFNAPTKAIILGYRKMTRARENI